MLASDVTSSYALYFRYDQNGAPIGFAYKTGSTTTEYYYLKNLQGDITGIVDTSGNRVATYVYDAWGNPQTATNSNTSLAERNSIRYRGYVYDSKTGLYYLQSRYYSPAIGLFINADVNATTGGVLGANMFAYCENNPVNGIDETGEIVGTIFDVASWCVTACEVTANPMDMWAWANLIADTFDFLPVVTGTGEAVRAIRAADRTVVAFNALAEAMQTGKKTKFSANLVGAIGEVLVGIDPKKKDIIKVGGNMRIPDALGKKFLAEVKNMSYISNTKQLQDFAKIAKERGDDFPMYLLVRRDTKIAQSVIDAGWQIKYIW